MVRSRRTLTALCLALALLVLAGCSSKPASPAPTPQPPSTPAAPSTTFHWYTTTNMTSFDPALVSDSNTLKNLIYQVYAGLVTNGDKGDVALDLAAGYKVSEDGKTYTFTLKDGIKFQSGRPITSEDIKWSMMRAANPALNSPVTFSYLDDIVGFGKLGAALNQANAPVRALSAQATNLEADVKAGKADQKSLDDLKAKLADAQKAAEGAVGAAWAEFQKDPGIDAPDPKTVVFHIDSPKAYFLAKLTYPTSWPVDKTLVPFDKPIATDPANAKLVNGAGPFKLTSYQDNASFTLTRWADYHGEKAKVGSIDVQIIKTEQAAFAKYQAGDLDIVGVPTADYQRIKNDPVLSQQLTEMPRASVSYFALNELVYTPARDQRVRQAFNYAVDKEALVKTVLNGAVFPAYSILPPGLPGGSGDKLQGLKYDPARARDLLKQAGYDGAHPLPPLTITFPAGNETNAKLAEFLQQMFQTNLGVKVALEPQEFGAMLKRQHAKTELQAMFLAWGADYMDPQNFLSTLLTCNSEYNEYGYCNKDLDAGLARADAAAPGDARYAMYAQIEQQMVNDAPWIPLNFGKLIYLTKPYLKGYRVNAMGAMAQTTVEILPH